MKRMLPMIVMVAIMVISLVFVVQGVTMHVKVAGEEETFHATLDEYYSLDKATRDSAPADSELNKKLVNIQQSPSELLKLKLVGVGKILTGIFTLLFGILIALIMMPIKLGKIVKGK